MTSLNIGGNGGNGFAFETIGDAVTGTILDLAEVQQTDFDGDAKVWSNGQPMMMYRVDLQTALRSDETDDGRRSVYLKGSRKPESQSSLAAVLGAVRTATGKTDLASGATLTLQYVGDGVPSQRGFNAPKFYAASYVAPALSLGAKTAPAQPVYAPPAAPVAPVYAPPVPAYQNYAPAVAAVLGAPVYTPPATLPAAPAGPPALTPELLAALAAAGIAVPQA